MESARLTVALQEKEQDRGVRNTSTHEVQRWCKKKVRQTCNTSKLGVGAGCKVQVKHARQKCESKSEVERCKATMWQRCKQVKVSVINGRVVNYKMQDKYAKQTHGHEVESCKVKV